MRPATATRWRGVEFRLGSIPVVITPMFFLVAIVFGGGSIAQRGAWMGVVFVSVMIHELGHALAMRSFGFSPSIELHALGGFTSWSREKLPTAGQRLIVTLCGPGAGLVLGGVMTLVRSQLPPGTHPLLVEVVYQAQWVNLLWSVINLMPVLPWDGGLILDAAIELIGRKPRPKIAAVVSIVVGAAIAALGIWKQQLIFAYFGGMGVWRGYARLSPPPEASVAAAFWPLMQAQKFDEAERLALEAIVKTPDGPDRLRLHELVAWSRLLREDWKGVDEALAQMKGLKPSRHLAAMLAAHTGRHDEVVALLTPLPLAPNELSLRADSLIALGRPEAVVADAQELLLRPQDADTRRGAQLLSARLFDAGAFELSLKVCQAAFAKLRDPIHLYNAACALVRLGRSSEALAALNQAIDAGYQDARSMQEDPDLAPLRTLGAWAGLIARMARS